MDTDVKTRFDDQVQVITDVGCRYKAAEGNAQTLEAEIKSLEATATKAKRLMDSAGKAQLTAKGAKERARLLAEHMTAAVSAEAGKMESGAPEPHDVADSVVTALKTMEAAKAATFALEAIDKSLKASREVCALTTARISTKQRELGVIKKDKEAYHGLLEVRYLDFCQVDGAFDLESDDDEKHILYIGRGACGQRSARHREWKRRGDETRNGVIGAA